MGDWGFLTSLLDSTNTHMTVFGKIWMVVFFVCRVMVLCGIRERVWSEALSRFTCTQPTHDLCADTCHDYHFPTNHFTYWTMQLIFVAAPTLIYLFHVMFITQNEDRLRQQLARPSPPEGTTNLRRPRFTDENGRVKIKGKLLLTYQFQLLLKMLIEVAFICGQWFLFGFEFKAEYKCIGLTHGSCFAKTRCLTSRPTEKTFFVRFMLAVACLSLLLNVLEMLYLLGKLKCCFRSCKRRNVDMEVLETAEEDPDSQPGYNTVMLNMEVLETAEEDPDILEMGNMQPRSLSGSVDDVMQGPKTPPIPSARHH